MYLCKFCWIRKVKNKWQVCWTCKQRYNKANERKEILKANQSTYKLSENIKTEINSILELSKNQIKKTNRIRYLYTLLYLIDILSKKDKELLIKFYFKVKDIVWPINHFIEEVMIKKWYDNSNKEFKVKDIQKNENTTKEIDIREILSMLKKITKAFDCINENRQEELIIEIWNIHNIEDEEELNKIINLISKYTTKITDINNKRKMYNKQYYNTIINMLNEVEDKKLQKIFYKYIWWYFQYTYTEIKPLLDIILKIKKRKD